MPSPSYEKRICAMFDSFSKMVSQNFVRNLDRAEGNQDTSFVTIKINKCHYDLWRYISSVPAGEEVINIQRIRCPNPKCGRHILDIEEMPPGETVLEMKCRRCGKVVQVGFGPRMVHKKNRRQG